MSEDSSTKYYKIVKKDSKKARERYQTLSKEKKRKKTGQYGREHYKIYQTSKSKSLLSIEKGFIKLGKYSLL